MTLAILKRQNHNLTTLITINGSTYRYRHDSVDYEIAHSDTISPIQYIQPPLSLNIDQIDIQRSSYPIETPQSRKLKLRTHYIDGCGKTPQTIIKDDVTCKTCLKRMSKPDKPKRKRKEKKCLL